MVKANRNFRSALQRRAGKVQSATGAASKRSREVRRAEELHARMRAVSAYEQAHKIGGIWYLVELRHHPFLLGGAFPGRTGRRDEAMAGENREPLIIYRDYWGVQAHNLKDGRLRWWTPASWSLQRMLGGAHPRKRNSGDARGQSHRAGCFSARSLPHNSRRRPRSPRRS